MFSPTVSRLCLVAPWVWFAAQASAQDVLVPLAGATTVASGFGHSCALKTDGAVMCWGRNADGQLGTGDYWSTATPVPVRGLPGAASAIATGKTHSCAIVSGAVWCWGANLSGELGSGIGTGDTAVPVAVSGLPPGATAVAAGDTFTCAVVAGAAWCWGDNTLGSLGDGSGVGGPAPVAVSGLGAGVTQISAGVFHACAIAGGAAKCWGNNGSGQVGNGVTGGFEPTPVQVIGLAAGVVSISASAIHSCAVAAGGVVKCWGSNGNGQLGTDAVSSSNVPVDATGLTAPARTVVTGALHTCVVGTDDTSRCWGSNLYSQLGDGEGPDSNVAVVSPGLAGNAQNVSSHGYHTCVLRTDGGVWCWGFNAYGQSGDGSREWRTQPVAVAVTDVGALAAGAAHTCAVVGGGVSCWGFNGEGAVGTGRASLSVPLPFAIPQLSIGATAVAAGYDHSCAVVNGGVWCWGNNEKGQLGDGTNNNADEPVAVKGLASGVTRIEAGGNRSCAVQNGDVLCWGYNANGELANGTTVDTNSPLPAVGLDGTIDSLSLGPNHGCAVVNGAAKCWGLNDSGQLGNGAGSGFTATPIPVQGLASGVTAISAGYSHSCAIVGGAAKCWGYDGYGQLGNGILNDTQLTPSAVTGLDAGVTAIAAGDDATCAVHDGSVLCWGGDYEGDLGNGGTPRTVRLVPTWAIGLANRAGGLVAINGTHACATTTGGGLSCWGDDLLGGLGIGRQVIVGTPGTVVLDDRIFDNGVD